MTSLHQNEHRRRDAEEPAAEDMLPGLMPPKEMCFIHKIAPVASNEGGERADNRPRARIDEMVIVVRFRVSHRPFAFPLPLSLLTKPLKPAPHVDRDFQSVCRWGRRSGDQTSLKKRPLRRPPCRLAAKKV